MSDCTPPPRDCIETSGRRIAFFGGSFDPPHFGHLAVARAARTALALDAVLFAPVASQPLKPHGSNASFEDRLTMTRLAIAGETGFSISLSDAPRPAGTPNYTIDALLALRAQIGPAGALYCLMGADSLASLKLWHRAAEIPFAATLVVTSRPGENLDLWKTALPDGFLIEDHAALPTAPKDLLRYQIRNSAGATAEFCLLPGLQVEISASEIRNQIRNPSHAPSRLPQSAPELLPESVSNYIRSRNLYL